METISIRIDDQDILAQKGATILEVALANKIYIPHLCYHPDLKPAGSCRVCLVELENGQLVTSCRTPVKDGMIIKTSSPEIDKVRRPVVEMIIANHHMDCKNCAKKGQCGLQRIMAYMKIDKKRIQQTLRLPEVELPLDESNPFFIRDHNKCVLCGICVRTCQEIARVSAIDFAGRGNNTRIAAFGDKPITQSKCVSCGECVIRCPVGALVVRNIGRPEREFKSICPYCGVGCGIYLGIKDNEIVSVRGDSENAVNNGNLCVKGRFGMGFVHSPDRLKNPLMKLSPKEQSVVSAQRSALKGTSSLVPHPSSLFKEATWDEALTFVARKLKKYKGDEIAVIASTKCTNEENYIAQKFARVVMGSNNIDTSVRLCYSPMIAPLRDIGIWVGCDSPAEDSEISSDLLRQNLEQIEQAACILVTGANITLSYPVLGLKIKKAVESGARLLVISPHENELCRIADIWLQPYPGTDLAFLMGMCNVIVEEALYDDAFVEMYCNNFEEFRESLDDFPLGRVERITGISRDLIEESARIYAGNKPGAIFWGTGITQSAHGTDNVYALANLSILTANIKYSRALNPLLGQNNALGACDMGCLPNYFPGYQPVDSKDAQVKFRSLWGRELNPEPGLTLTEILDATLKGKIKALYIIGSDMASNIAPSKKVHAALKKAKFVVFQDMFINETAKYAHVILPAASFAEKTGTFINTEGRVQRIQKALKAIGDSRPDWEILCELAKRLKSEGFEFENTEDILSELLGAIKDVPEVKRKFSLFPLKYRPPEEATDIDYPLILTTERDFSGDGVMSEKVEGLKVLRMKDFVYINPKDAADFEIEDGEPIRVISRHGAIESGARLRGTTPAGLVVMNLEEEKVNKLLNPVLDEESKTPDMKMCAIRIEKMKTLKKK